MYDNCWYQYYRTFWIDEFNIFDKLMMLGSKIFKKKNKEDNRDENVFSISFFIAIINLAFESYFFPLNTLWQLLKLTKS